MSIFSDILSAITTKGRKLQIKMGLAKDFNDSKLDVGELGLVIDTDEVRIGLADGTTKELGGLDVADLPNASATTLGVVKVGTNINVTSGTVSVANASTSAKGVVQLNDTLTSTSTTLALTAKQGNEIKKLIDNLTASSGGITIADIPIASATQDGIMPKAMVTKLSGIATGANFVQVTDSVTSTSTTQALSANQGKLVNDKLGNLTSLQTTNKNNLVDAINEVKQIGNNVKQNTVDALLSVDNSLPITSSSTWSEIITQISNIKVEDSNEEGGNPKPIVPIESYVLATDDDFRGTYNGGFEYIGAKEYVIIPNKIKGIDITSYEKMFLQNTVIKGVASFNPNVSTMYSMFLYCASLTSLDLSYFDTSNVTAVSNMFNGCTSLTSLNLSSFDTSNVTDMTAMFYNCASLTSLDLSYFDTSNVTAVSNMFNGCTSLTSLNLSSFDTSNVTTMTAMFRSCTSLTSLDLSYFDTTNVTNMGNMFFGCSSLTIAYAKNQVDADKFNATSNKPTTFTFIIKP